VEVVKARYLVDKSALARMRHESVRRRLAPIIEAGEVATCAIIDLEILFSARTHADYVETRRRRSLAYERVPLAEQVFERALEIQEDLARIGHHRLPIPDLVIAAAAESAALTVLHYDRDFDTIAAVTGQPMEWVVPRGSVP
jgi:predicted nucleic acid-binding protein